MCPLTVPLFKSITKIITFKYIHAILIKQRNVNS